MGYEKITKTDLENVIIGATYLGSGGGGSYQGSIRLLQALPDSAAFEIPQVWDLAPDAWINENALIGSPAQFLANPTFDGAVNALQVAAQYAGAQKANGNPYYQSYDGFKAIFPVEAGAVNILAPFLVANAVGGGLTVFNCDGAGRSVPLLALLDYAGKYFPFN